MCTSSHVCVYVHIHEHVVRPVVKKTNKKYKTIKKRIHVQEKITKQLKDKEQYFIILNLKTMLTISPTQNQPWYPSANVTFATSPACSATH